MTARRALSRVTTTVRKMKRQTVNGRAFITIDGAGGCDEVEILFDKLLANVNN
jgi:hypothetical protein